MTELEMLGILPGLFIQDAEVLVGPGDDCAVIRPDNAGLQLLTVDQVVEGVHYLPGEAPSRIAEKLLKRNISDIAAMGGRPTRALLALALSRRTASDRQWIEEFFRAIAQIAEKWHISVCGGDISGNKTGNDLASLTLCGTVAENRLCLRSSARSGNKLYVTGEFGNSFASGHHLDFTPRLEEALFLAGEFSRCIIDVTDGLLRDASHLAVSSKLEIILDTENIPLRQGANTENALNDGEDYELLFAVPADKVPELENTWPFPMTKLSCIGEFKSSGKFRIRDLRNRILFDQAESAVNPVGGFDHFFAR